MKLKLVALGLFCLIVGACSEDDRSFTESELVGMYTDILLIRAEHADTALANPRVDSLLQAHGYTIQSYEQELTVLYQQHGMRMLEFLDSVKATIDDRRLRDADTAQNSNP